MKAPDAISIVNVATATLGTLLADIEEAKRDAECNVPTYLRLKRLYDDLGAACTLLNAR